MKYILCILSLCCIIGCNSIEQKKQIQQEFNNEAIYFIQNDGVIFLNYVKNDNFLCLRDKICYKQRWDSLHLLISKFNKNNK